MKMTKKTTRQPKRIKAWINEYDWGLGTPRESIREARNASEFRVGTCRVAVRVVELRRGEVIVDGTTFKGKKGRGRFLRRKTWSSPLGLK